MNHYEHKEQCLVIAWKKQMCALPLNPFPGLETLHSIPNGGDRPKRQNLKTGKWYSLEAQRMVKEGLTAGMPDLHLPVARRGWHSLYIEMKEPDKKLSPEQVKMIALLRNYGHLVVVCYSGQEAIDTIAGYLKGDRR